MAESRAMSGIQSPQEMGITQGDASLPFFGPATRDEYDPDQWTMVAATRESPEPGPSGRRRTPGAPAFLRCRKTSWDVHRLGGILTMLHEIPAARNVLLQSGTPAANYGSSSQWWKGIAIAQRIRDDDGWPQAPSATEADVSEELHRVMAFLDATERSYGTADVLADLIVANGMSVGNVENKFFDMLFDASQDSRYHALWTYVDEVPVVGEEPSRRNHFGLLDFRLMPEQYSRVDTLYGVLDTVLWPDVTDEVDADAEDLNKMAVITAMGDVISLRFEGPDPPYPIQIPDILYLDRYEECNKKEAVKLQGELRAAHHALWKATTLQDKLTKWVEQPNQRTRDRRDLSKQAIDLHQRELWKVQTEAAWRRHEALKDTPDSFDFTVSEIPALAELNDEEEKAAQHYAAEAAVHEKKIAEIDRKLESE